MSRLVPWTPPLGLSTPVPSRLHLLPCFLASFNSRVLASCRRTSMVCVKQLAHVSRARVQRRVGDNVKLHRLAWGCKGHETAETTLSLCLLLFCFLLLKSLGRRQAAAAGRGNAAAKVERHGQERQTDQEGRADHDQARRGEEGAAEWICPVYTASI
ncbi:uncharacterized protein F5Z01DRAFT_411090 [Emericellopsis atlantica]|uniref:Uncharacterized protein n=1 Tax=Emericellopsis atlantica TaxID=2614577 RepID=A0A9P8CST7_9HYPO|nr:uncharacterized protein F5Z01DRAFT_411090 [Emericellopsis atlantica]KAG9257712.1 hypothetical protein F5Z01DRAFT_411090 [Emericellopsis atlantica]